MDCQTAKSGLFIDPLADNGLENGANRGGMDETIAHVAGLGKVVPHLYDPSDLALQALSAGAAADLEDIINDQMVEAHQGSFRCRDHSGHC